MPVGRPVLFVLLSGGLHSCWDSDGNRNNVGFAVPTEQRIKLLLYTHIEIGLLITENYSITSVNRKIHIYALSFVIAHRLHTIITCPINNVIVMYS